MISSGRGNRTYAPQGELQIKNNGIKYLSQLLTDKFPNVVYDSLVVDCSSFFEKALQIMDYFSKQRKKLVCNVKSARNLTP